MITLIIIAVFIVYNTNNNHSRDIIILCVIITITNRMMFIDKFLYMFIHVGNVNYAFSENNCHRIKE